MATHAFYRLRFLFVLAIVNLAGHQALRAASLLVYNLNDSGPGSLRQAVQDNATLGGGNTVLFSNTVAGTILLLSGELPITNRVTIQGPGANVVTLSGNSVGRIFNITGSNVSISGLSLLGAGPTDASVHVFPGASLVLGSCTVVSNACAGVYNEGTLRLTNSTFAYNTNNSAFGGGMANWSGAANVTNCTFSANSSRAGGGIYCSSLALLSVNNCTVVSNFAAIGPLPARIGGGIANFSTGLPVGTNRVFLRDTIVAGNATASSGQGPDVDGGFNSGGYNLIGQGDASTGLTNGVNHDLVGSTAAPTNALVGPLQNNGGPTPTMALIPGSPAIDQGISNGLTLDQRGQPRDFDFPSVPNAGDGADIGAFEASTLYSITLNSATLSRAWAISNSPAQNGFLLSASATVQAVTNTSVLFNYQLVDAVSGVPVPLQATQAVISVSAGGTTLATSLSLVPTTQLDCVDKTFRIVLTLAHISGGPAVNDLTNTIGPVQLFHFDGRLLFGNLTTYFTNVEITPTISNVVPNDHLDCSLVVSFNAGYLPSVPGHTYGEGRFGSPIPISLFVNGDAALRAGGSISLHGPSPDLECIQNICFQRTNLLLTATGAVSSVILSLPIGFSIGPSLTNRLTIGSAFFAGVPLDASLHPAGGSIAASGLFYAVEETLPCWFAANSFTWLVNLGQVQLNVTGGEFVRKQEDDLLTATQASLIDTNAANRISNDGYFRNGAPNPGLLIVAADANGVARITTANGLSLQPPELRPHFPYAPGSPGHQIPTGTGLLMISNGLPASNSHLNLAGPVPITYGRDCTLPGCTAGQAGPATLSFTATGAQLSFTADGGLFAYGSVPQDNLKWGFATGTSFAQVAGSVSAGAFCIAGTFLLSDQTSVDNSQRAAATLFSGFGDASNPNYLERPGQPAYINGLANYPGLNFRAPAQGSSYVGQQNIGPYALNPASKYYLRFGGVNGIHMAASPPPPVPLYGYNFTFSSYGFSYRDGRNVESRADGAISFPAEPAGFIQEFDRMKVTCRGDLSSAQVPATAGTKRLNYWNVAFTPQSLDFRPTSDDACGTSPRVLALGVETTLPFIPQALHAVLGFWPNGNLVTPADGVGGVDSRFQVPSQLSVQGPGTTMFALSTASEGYFNNWVTPGAAALPNGFYNLAGKLRVPFFSDIKVHLQVTSAGGTNSHIDIMGGWPAADSTAADLGWSVNSSNYFNTEKFDPASNGWPAAQGIALSDYIHASSPDGKYHPRAERDWIEVAKFDYPLAWNSALHRFSGFQDAKVILPVIDVNSRLKELAPGKVDFDFAQDVTLQLPRVKVLDFVNDALNGDIGPLLSVSNVIRDQLQTGLDTTGLNELSHLLREDAQSFFNPILNTAIDNALSNSVMAQLAALPQTNPAVFLQLVYSTLATGNALQTAISGINGTTSDANKVTGAINKTLTDVEATAGLLYRILNKDGNGNRHVVEEIVKKLVQDQGPGLGFVVSVGDAELNPLLADIEPTLAEIQGDIQDASNQLAQVQTTLTAANGDFSQALTGALQDASGISDFMGSAAANVTNYLASVLTPAGDLFTNNPAAVQQAIRQQIAMAFLASALPANYQRTFRQFLYDKDFLLDQVMDTLFDQINLTIRNALSASIGAAQDSVFQNLKGAGLLSQSLLSAKIRGAPTFNGDSLRKIHLDAAIKMNLPDEMNFNAHMDIKELDSQSAPLSCIPVGAPAAEVTLGAKDVKLDWPGVTPSDGKPLTMTLDARWTLQHGAVLGIGGLLDIKGEAGFEGCTVKDIGATLAIGELENYFAAKAAGTVVVLFIPVDLQAGIFVGHSCSLDPLKFVDPEAEQVLGDPAGFSGVYVQYGGGLSLSEILFGSSSCLLDIEASINTSEFYQGGPRLGRFGGRQKSALDASLLCVLSGHADWSEFMSVDTSSDPANVTLGGSAEICGSIGKCPFCLSKCAGITVKGVLSTGGIDYFIDY